MIMLIFRVGGYEVATTSWTASAKNGSGVDIAYLWGADGVSFFDSATSTRRVAYDISMSDLLARKRGNVIDLR